MSKPDHPTRLRILRAAEVLFAECGYAGVSMRSIATMANVQLGGLPYHFGTKEALYRAIWQHWVSKTDARIAIQAAASPPDSPIAEQLRSLVKAFYDGPSQLLMDPHGKHFVKILVREANDPAGADRGLLRDYIFPSGEIFRQEFESLLPNMPFGAMNLAIEMMISGLRIVIERQRHGASDGEAIEETNRLFSLVTDFVVDGWLGLIRREEG
jgi:TetR/AcrR family transcriptional regulator, regulator of cefoperazone and chloramphenicol sensitivity